MSNYKIEDYIRAVLLDGFKPELAKAKIKVDGTTVSLRLIRAGSTSLDELCNLEIALGGKASIRMAYEPIDLDKSACEASCCSDNFIRLDIVHCLLVDMPVHRDLLEQAMKERLDNDLA